MELFFLENFSSATKEIQLSPEESRHLVKSLRKRPGDTVDLTDGNGHHILAEIVQVTGKNTRLAVKKVKRIPFPPLHHFSVGLAIIRPNRMDWAVEKLTELGVESITPLICQYSTIKQVKWEHLRKVAVSAIKQSRQFYLPRIDKVKKLKEWLGETTAQKGPKFIAHPDSDISFTSKILKSSEIGITLLIGPEGGFHSDELNLAQAKNFIPINLGSNILRSETAAVVAVSQIKLLLKNEKMA